MLSIVQSQKPDAWSIRI